MSITSADVLLIAPELSGISGSQWTAILGDVALEVGLTTWGTQAAVDRGSKYLAAHLATLTKRAGTAGQIQSETVGPVSRTFAVPQRFHPTSLDATVYGQEFLRQLKNLGVARLVWG